jgi:restriction system protein
MSGKSGPKFVQYFGSVLEALKDLGGSGRPKEVIEYIAETEHIDESEQKLLSDGTPRFNKNINWARFYLAKSGFIDGSTRGVWALTEKGLVTTLSQEQALKIFNEVHGSIEENRSQRDDIESESSLVDDEERAENPDHRKSILEVLYNLPPSGFERLCQRLLRESGFERVLVTGRSGDGGIDGQGILRINHFVTFRVSFQCKRYRGTVGTGAIRDFRGSIDGRADKGIFMTTGVFSTDAKIEAAREGAKPIELVDGEALIDMLEELELGLTKKQTITIYNVDHDFFNEFNLY